MKKIMLVMLIIFLFSMNNILSKERKLPEEAIRLRVIANSNSLYDQEIKMKVKEEVQNDMYNLLNDIEDIEEARTIITNNIWFLDNNLKKFLENEKYYLGHSIELGDFYFQARRHMGITYEEGYYESVLVKLGQGKGDNWWCVLFPPLCLLEAHESSEIEYKFFLKEIIQKYFK